MESRRLATTLAAAAAVLALGACTKQETAGTDSKQSVGAKIDRALDKTQQKLERAGEKARQDIEVAAEKTQETMSRAGEKLSNATSNAVNDVKSRAGTDLPLAPRRPVTDNTTPATPSTAAGDATATGSAAGNTTAPASTTGTTSSGPTPTVKSSALSQETRDKLADAAITASIKADFLKDPDLSVLKIDVDTHDGVVTLNGLADNAAAKTRAERMAQSVKGVREVHNYLTVKRLG